ncbi:MAG: tyrosine-type recombinase/integrase [Pyrinomonadaceae bacterium]
MKDDQAILAALEAWAEKTTGALSYRREELQHDKQSSVLSFFTYTSKHPFSIRTRDCLAWRRQLEERYKPNTVYARLSRLSSFYNWLLSDPILGKHLRSNPVILARPKCPPPYQAESSKSLTDNEMNRLLRVVKKDADEGSIVGKRDYALLLLYFLSGLRRTEIISLRGKDVEIAEDKLLIKYKRKGGRYTGREVADTDIIEAIEDYLMSSGRTNVFGSERPIWTRHDRAGRAGAPLTSHAFVKNIKHYAQAAKVKGFHLHQTRHTFARIFAEDSGSMMETQEALDHANVATTRAYVQRIAVKRDKFSASIKRRIKSD